MDLELKEVDINEIKPYERNPRKNDQAVDAVIESIKQCGYIAPIIVDENMVILAGHTRWKALKRLNYTTVKIAVKDGLTEEQKRKYRLLDNKTNEYAEWDYDMLAVELEGLDFGDLTVDWGVEAVTTDIDSVVEDESPDVDEEHEPITRPGDIWLLGRHRLLCGDSTKQEDVARLMDNHTADMVVTDPPYNVDYEGGTAEKLKIQNDNQTPEQFVEFLIKAFENMRDNLKEGGAFYIWHASSSQREFENALNNVGLHVRQQLIWVKNALVLGHQDYQWRHEPCFYGWKERKPHYFTDDRTETTVLEGDEIDFKSLKKEELVKLLEKIYSELKHTTLYEDKPQRNAEHPTMKPVRLFSRLINNSSTVNEKVLDLFGGSGTSIIACERLKRRGFTREADPEYCDVIIKRWENLTGKKAVRYER